MTLLQVDHLTVDFKTRWGTVRAVNNVSFSMEKGETMGLVGESGSGKSTLGFALVRLVPPPGVTTNGSIKLESKDVLNLNEKEIRLMRGRRVAFVFQNPMTSLNPVKKIGDHFIEFLRTHNRTMRKNVAVENTKHILEELGIPVERINDYPHQFSGGMRQRIMIGLAIALNPGLVVADEPTTALDVIVQDKILDLMSDLSRTHDMALILITHDLSIVMERCDKIFVMYAGHQVEHGESKDLYKDPKHPYTQGLLRSIPNIELLDQKLSAIPGSPPDMLNLPEGCPFWPRCSQVMKICRAKEPPTIKLKNGRLVKCFLYGGAQA
ncbi:MAG: ABC transporter ATP-binding protein [Candidatus Bathyarchaeota archaeon]|nr:MAG: ABC transporter ATP-binding protein [Candidatus Bathyarchaeota archaeon]